MEGKSAVDRFTISYTYSIRCGDGAAAACVIEYRALKQLSNSSLLELLSLYY